jgi:hypothetical protein
MSPEQILARRRSRIAFGAVLAVGAIVVGVGAWMFERGFDGNVGPVLVGVWMAAFTASHLVRALPVRLMAMGAGPTSPVSTGAGAVADRATALGRLSVSAPLFGVAMMAPLSLHLCVAALVGNNFQGFSGWVALSTVLTLHAHLALGLHGMHFARVLDEHDHEDGLPYPCAAKGASGAVTAMLVSLFPGAVALLVPPFLVFITGLTFAPLAYHVVGRRFEAEKAVLSGG